MYTQNILEPNETTTKAHNNITELEFETKVKLQYILILTALGLLTTPFIKMWERFKKE